MRDDALATRTQRFLGSLAHATATLVADGRYVAAAALHAASRAGRTHLFETAVDPRDEGQANSGIVSTQQRGGGDSASQNSTQTPSQSQAQAQLEAEAASAYGTDHRHTANSNTLRARTRFAVRAVIAHLRQRAELLAADECYERDLCQQAVDAAEADAACEALQR
jgi:hypothetical protein